jgi:hypothetical protein
LFVGLVSVVGCASPVATTSTTRTVSADVVASSPPQFRWDLPTRWKSETIPFPLPFAPSLPYRGVEELRFEPKFFDASAPTYFSYSFAWILDDDATPLTGERLSGDLARYFSGLAHEVSPNRFDAAAHDARMTRAADGTYRGEVHTVDAFGDGRKLLLHVAGESILCEGHRVLLLSLSPREHVAELDAQRRSFRCLAR